VHLRKRRYFILKSILREKMNRIRMQVMMVAALVMLLSAIVRADEGMWPLDVLKELPWAELKSRGLQLDPEQIYAPKDGSLAFAVVRVGGGTGSFVSPQGLIVTNHHVAFSAIQKQSTPENNYLNDGFYAASREKELPAIGYHVYVLRSFEDVTSRVLGALKEGAGNLERYQTIERMSKEIVREAESAGDVKCKVASMYDGEQYYLFSYFRIRDVRLVYAPPRSIGDYGGEIDNWMWPRHAGDFAFFRAYVAPDGSSADYSEDNVPYDSKVYLDLSSAGVKNGDFVMLIGFPGRTKRYQSSFSIDQMINHDYPLDISTRQDLIAILEAASSRDSSVAIRLSSGIKGLYNYLKKNQGMLEGFERAKVLQRKMDQEKSLREGLSRNPELKEKYGDVLSELDSLFREYGRFQDKDFIVSWMTWHCRFLGFASTIYKWSLEKEKDDLDREPGYQDRDSLDTKEDLEDAQVNLVPSVDKEMLIYFLRKAVQLPGEQKIQAIERIVEGIADNDKFDILKEFAEDLYRGTQLGMVENRLRMFAMSREELVELNDSFINFAIQLESEKEELRIMDKKFSGALTRLQPKFIKAQAEYQDKKLYPDANSTLRFNYGEVKGYSPKDAVYFTPLTSLAGAIQKNTGREPFDVPSELENAYSRGDFGRYPDASLGDIPVDFLSTCDVTNGNSGSPVMNGKGELVGLVFDGNYESISSDYLFEPDITRTINVDIRYVLFLLDKVYHAEGLLKELAIK
jgi:hypothetical protein